jgi:hypothetical protein
MVKIFAGITEGMHFFETDGGQGDDRHIQGIEDIPAFDRHVADHAKGYEQAKHDYGNLQMTNRIHRLLLRRKE